MTLIMMKMKKAYERNEAYENGVWKKGYQIVTYI